MKKKIKTFFLRHKPIHLTAMRFLWAFIVAFQACWAFSQSQCTKPPRITPPSFRVAQLCPNSECQQQPEKGEICHCNAEFIDYEPEPVANNQNKVRAVMTKRMCWERDQEDGWRNYDDCANDGSPSCIFDDKIEICYEDNIDVAQAMCRHFNKGDAFGAQASASRRKLEGRNSNPDRRITLAKLRCPMHSENLYNCSMDLLPAGIRCPQMVAKCWFSPCWQKDSVIRTTASLGLDNGPVSGRVRYGQACKLNSGNDGICSRHCYRCPRDWKGNPRDGERCFSTEAGNSQADLVWEPHFRTLDGKHFDFQGQCSYYLLKNAHFSIVAKFRECGTHRVTCAQEITINSGHTELRLGQGNDFSIKYRGRLLRLAKKPFHNNDINYYLASSEFDAVDVWNGFKILWDRKAEYRAIIPNWNINMLTRGLLGNRNNNTEDDMIMPNGELTTDPLQFGNSWMVPGSCPPGVSAQAPPNPVLTEKEKSDSREKGCKYMNPDGNHQSSIHDPFKNCDSPAAKEERKAKYNNCLMDVATCDRDLNDCLCPTFEFLADYCETNKESVGNWRSKMPDSLCQLNCNAANGEVFRMNANSCNQTCDAIKYIRDNMFECIEMKVEGCNCQEGYARDANGKCIPVNDCPN